MKIKLKDKTLVDEYIVSLTAVEKILWQGKMGTPPKYLENYRSNNLINSLFLFLFITISYNISNGGVCFMLFVYSLPASLYLISRYESDQEQLLDFNRTHTQYLLTDKRIILMIYNKGIINIQSILYEDIKKVYSSKRLANWANIYLETKKPVDFQTFKYWSQNPHDKIVLVQIKDYQRVLDRIQEHMF